MGEYILEVLDPGVLTSVQDLGREGHQDVGIPPSGAMDAFALRAGNLLVKNPTGEAGLEMTVRGGTYKVLKDLAIAFTGGDMELKVNGTPLPRWEALKVKAGDILSFGIVRMGCRGYLCIAGGIDVPLILGSKSTYMMARLGGYRGRALRKGDKLSGGEPHVKVEEVVGRRLRQDIIPPDSLRKEIRIVVGPQEDYVSSQGIQEFFEAQWKVSSKANRMGYRFQGGPEVKWAEKAYTDIGGPNPDNIIDDGIPLGGIQLPGGIEPIVLLVDGPSAGGFVKIGCVIRPDIDRLGQSKPGDPIRFVKATADEAAAIYKGDLAKTSEQNIIKGNL